jgi:hypothetical protein
MKEQAVCLFLSYRALDSFPLCLTSSSSISALVKYARYRLTRGWHEAAAMEEDSGCIAEWTQPRKLTPSGFDDLEHRHLHNSGNLARCCDLLVAQRVGWGAG